MITIPELAYYIREAASEGPTVLNTRFCKLPNIFK